MNDNHAKNIPALFGSRVFNDAVMRARLPRDIYVSLHKTIAEGKELDLNVANSVASAMKDWAIEHGATHFTHWFQPMTGITAEKHDSFLSPQNDGTVIMEFSGKELIKGEPDASSFPSGGLRATFEARGYTAWDPTSYAFIKDDSLCIPTVFCAYSGEVLDKKTPLLRSMEVIGRQAMRILRAFGYTDVTRVTPTVGPEQEYFLVDEALAKKRRDLTVCGRTLFGSRPAKGQDLDDHYFGSIRPRVMAYMQELNEELWKLGIYAKTEHNEAAPAQHELAPVFTTANFATDHNQLTMEVMKKVAERHGLSCLLHEKPFAGVSGSGKHNNWSLQTDTGMNLFKPGKQPGTNRLFLMMMVAVISAVEQHQDLLRISVASAGNDHRLGGDEAPPSIVSMYIGEDMIALLDAISEGRKAEAVDRGRMSSGLQTLPNFQKDGTDRNRTSPMAFTGNKFEFRMLGSSQSVAETNVILNTIVADVLRGYADRMEQAEYDPKEADAIIAEEYRAHKRILFNGNNYSKEWVEEAKRRGLLNLRTTVDALAYYASEENIALFTRNAIYTESEITSRTEILYENYCKILNIECRTMLEMARREILPAVMAYAKALADGAKAREAIGMLKQDCAEMREIHRVYPLMDTLSMQIEQLEDILRTAQHIDDFKARARAFADTVIPGMNALRASADKLETLVGAAYWPLPTYGELLFSV